MRAVIGLVTLVVLASGCTLYFHGDDGDDIDVCTLGEPAIAPAPLRNPETLQCESFGGFCNPDCGPCPAIARQPIPTWGACGGICDEHASEDTCAADPTCRVIKDARCMIDGNCLTDFMECVAIDAAADTSINCFTAGSADCSRSNQCSALHSAFAAECPPQSTAQGCPRPFELCVPEGQSPGRCFGQVTCAAATPACPSGKTPGVLAGCYTGACIPLDLCAPS